MSEQHDIAQLKHRLAELRAAVDERAAAEEQLTQNDRGRGADFSTSLERTRREVEQRHAADHAEAQERHHTHQANAVDHFERENQSLHRSWQSALAELAVHYERETDAVEQEMADARWMVTSVLDEEFEQSHDRDLKNYQAEIAATAEQLDTEFAAAEQGFQTTVETLQRCRQWRTFAPPTGNKPPANRSAALNSFRDAFRRGKEQTASLRGLWLPRMFAGWLPVLLMLLIWSPLFAAAFLLAAPVARNLGFTPVSLEWGMATGCFTLMASLLVVLILREITRTKTWALFEDIQQAAYDIKVALNRWRAFSERELGKIRRQYDRKEKAHRKERKKALARIDGIAADRLQDITQRQQAAVQDTNRKFTALIESVTETRDRRVSEANEHGEATVARLSAEFDRELQAVTQQQETERNRKVAEEHRERLALAKRWTAAVSTFGQYADQLNRRCCETSPAWESLAGEDWTLPEQMPDVVRVGAFDCDLQNVPNGLSPNRRLWPERSQFELPAVLSFPEHASLLLKTRGEGRTAATDVIRTVMLRLLTSLPRGKVRFTVIDPVGMGEPFSAFMHLADYDEMMIGSRIWTDSGQIEKQLAELSEHMENIFQSYLRNEFETIDEYNRHAGEVAEPYHVLVVANFPVNMSEIAARRLANIVASGARCGVLTLISLDLSQPMPHQFNLSDLETNAFTAEWKSGRFVACDPKLATLPLSFDNAPPARDFSRIVKTAGRLSQDARRVEVSFDRIAPRGEDLWSLSSKAGIEIPLGRAGATKLQSLRLGRGTSQHVLIVGKTGSGKSSFLHALITNLSLHYSPDDVEFYLIDFKKGVEFKTYATHGLPHARVIGIESDREFGVSVLERLDAVMQERGDTFRAGGVQDIAGYRNANPNQRLPRILLVVDEFQEFFVEDDALSHTATQLLDRLVRQGRAFGIHVLLGSQTLGGAYSLPRSTIGQFAVRIALQCSDSDAHLILSEDNTAARLLTRPGEAIYNDANGLFEGNHPFQVAWLPDVQREAKLLQIRAKAGRSTLDHAPPVVFEGNVASNLSHNQELTSRIESCCDEPNPAVPRPVLAWLGEAVSIKPASQIVFTRRPGDNLLIVGQDADSAQGVMAATLLAAAAQLPATSLKADDVSGPFVLLTDNADEKPDVWAGLTQAVPHAVRRAGCDDALVAIRELAEEVRRRSDDRETTPPPIFLFISDLSRFRDLRNERDEFDFSGMNETKPAGGGVLLAGILRDGPAVGVHAVVWCDTHANLSRWCPQATQREFEMRVVFRMNSNDSSHLIDSTAAVRLGSYRALLYRSESGTLEKFRPYAVPSAEWLAWADDRFHGRDAAFAEWQNLDTLTVV